MATIKETGAHITPDAAASQSEIVIFVNGPTPTITKSPQGFTKDGRELRVPIEEFLKEHNLLIFASDDSYLYLQRDWSEKDTPAPPVAPVVEPTPEPEPDGDLDDSNLEEVEDLPDDSDDDDEDEDE